MILFNIHPLHTVLRNYYFPVILSPRGNSIKLMVSWIHLDVQCSFGSMQDFLRITFNCKINYCYALYPPFEGSVVVTIIDIAYFQT